MGKQYLIQCDYCHEWEYRSRPQARFCCDAHKTEYHRSGPLPFPEEDPSQSVTDPLQADNQAINGDENTELLRAIVTEMGNLKSMMIALMGGQRLDDAQKKSDFTGATPIATEKPIDPPTVTVVYDEEAARRRTIENTMKSLQDFDF